MSPLTAAQIRRQFLEFFEQQHGHTIVPSSPVVPHDDPTLLFTNAGMNQFKDVFIGTGSRPYKRAVDTQKCIRAGGKHNDLDDVGTDTYHHTFFEMLGNWSFGDYFKAEAIQWAWQLLTEIWQLDPTRLYATVFAGDEADGLPADTEAEELWRTHTNIDHSHISRWGRKDNFWEMGDTGPCGPCTEIHYDFTPDRSGGGKVNLGSEDVIEIWNLVFIQFNRGEDGTLAALPERHVDTGMGFERICRVLQGKASNYDIDLWDPIFDAIRQTSGARPYAGKLDDPIDTAYRVIADHLRALVFAIVDGAQPGNDGRGYVLRRILRRAARFGRQRLNVAGPFIHHCVPAVAQAMAHAFPELGGDLRRVSNIILDEEESFARTLDRGLELFAVSELKALAESLATENGHDFLAMNTGIWPNAGQRVGDKRVTLSFQDREGNQIDRRFPTLDAAITTLNDEGIRGLLSAEDAFKLHDTYGFPIDLTEQMAREHGMTVDFEGYNRLMEEARQKARAGAAQAAPGGGIRLGPDEIARLKHMGVQPTRDNDKFRGAAITARIKAIWNGTDFDGHTHAPGSPEYIAIITNRTNFYAEMGGQVGDTGRIFNHAGAEFEVADTRSFGGYVLHIGRSTRGKFKLGDPAELVVNKGVRDATMANHTATHLLNLALRKTLNKNADQKGSLVASDRLRFDFAHENPLTVHQARQVTDLVNEAISNRMAVHAAEKPIDLARTINGLRAVFGERYPDPVRVVSIGVPIDDLIRDPTREDWLNYSVEFCGGTHVRSTDEIGAFAIVSEEAVGKGVRRVIALTGQAATHARATADEISAQLRELESTPDDRLPAELSNVLEALSDATLPIVDRHDLHARIEVWQKQVADLRKQAVKEARSVAVDQARQIAQGPVGSVIVELLADADADALRAAMDVIVDRHPTTAALLLSANETERKVAIFSRVPQPLIDKGLKAGDWVKHVAQVCGGGGGGRPDMAQAGGKDPSKASDALQAARDFASQFVQ